MVSVVCLALLLTNYSGYTNAQPAETYSTGNIVINTPQGGPSSWVNGVYQDNLTCWGWGNPGYCGPNAIVRPGNVINYSFGTTDLYQVQSIENVLPNSGTGLQVTGYTFGFTAKNGNGWDDGRVDYLNAYVNLYDRSGAIVTNKTYNLNYKFNWTTFNFNETFTTPYAASSLGNVRYGLVGRDNNGWAGPYGPEVYNINFSLKYSVDPCSTNVLSSPSCPGYLSAINTLTPATTTVQTAPVNTITTLPIVADTPSAEVKVDAGGVQVSTTGSISAPDNIPQSVKESQKSEENKPAPNMNLIMSVVRQVQANDRATQQAAVQNALQEVSNAIANAQEQTNMVIASNQRSNERLQQEISTSVTNSNSVVNITTQVQRATEAPTQPAQIIQTQLPKVDYSLSSTIPTPTTIAVNRVEQKNVEMESTQQSNVMGLNSPINNILQQRMNIDNTNVDQPTETVKGNVQPNELAGNIDIASIAVNPAGFAAYTSLTIKDGQLYKPEEIYKNQVTVDNARALRQLSSDRLHQEMVNQQYRN